MSVDHKTQIDIYRRMTLISQSDARARAVISSGRLVMPYYSPKGQEAIPSAISVNLRPDDMICTIYRGMHDMLAKGVPLNQLWAEFAGKATGTCKGKGGPMHISDRASGVMVTTGIVGSSMPIANGLAWGAQLDGSDRVAVAYFGDGASNIGAFHESLNLASLWSLPVIFVCQNNQFAEHTTYENGTSVGSIADRAASYAMPGVRVDGNDPLAVHDVAARAIARARNGEGPTLIEAMTFRFYGHVFGDADKYIDPARKAAAMAADPTKLFRQRLMDNGVADEATLAEIEAEIERQLDEAVAYALSSPNPDSTEIFRDVYATEIAQ